MSQPSPQPVQCGLRHKLASKCLQVFEGIMAKMLLIISICSIVYSNNWLPVFINFTFFALAIFAILSYAQCYRRVQPVLVLPMLIHLTVCIFWIFIWLYASATSITTGALWSLEWLGGPRSSREKTSSDIKDPNYVNPNETHPEIKKSIKYGMIIMVASFIILCLKCVGWIIARRTWRELRQRRLDMERKTEKAEEESDLGAASPPYPVVVRVPPKKSSPPPSYEVEPLKNVRFYEDRNSLHSPSSHLESSI